MIQTIIIKIPGPQGAGGWSPVLSLEVVNEKTLLKVLDWTGGAGTKPAVDLYVSGDGYTADPAAGLNVGGPRGISVSAAEVEEGTGDIVFTYTDDSTERMPATFAPALQARADAIQAKEDTEQIRVDTLGLKNEAAASAASIVPWQPLGGWNAATNSPAIAAGVSGGVSVGRGYDCTVPGTNSITGTSENWFIGDAAVWNGSAWYRRPAYTNIVDPKQSQNLIRGAILTPAALVAQLGSTVSTATTSLIYRQTGTVAAITKVTNFQNFPYAARLEGFQPASRVNFFGNRMLTTEQAPVGSKLSAGFFLYVPPGGVVVTVQFTILNSTAVTSQDNVVVSTSFIDCGNGLRWYYTPRALNVVSTPADNLVHVGMYIYTDATSAVGDFYFAAPAVVKSSQILAPGFYMGHETVPDTSTLATKAEVPSIVTSTVASEIPNYRFNHVKDWRFQKQTLAASVLASPWEQATAGSANLRFLPDISFVNETSPVGTRVLRVTHMKRSSDNYLSDHQLKQLVVIPNEWVGVSTMTIWLWVRRDSSLIGITAAFNNYYSDVNGSTAISSGYTPAPVFTETVVGEYMLVRYENVPVPANTRSLRLGLRTTCSNSAALDTPYYLYIAGVAVSFGTASAKVFPMNLEEKVAESTTPVSLLSGKKVTWYGDSIIAANMSTVDGVVAAGREADLIAKTFGNLSYIRGVGGTKVIDNGTIAWFDANGLYLARPDNGGTQPPGSIELDSAMSTIERISTIPLDTDILFIRGGTNDMVSHVIGTVDSPHDNTTFCGAYMLMLDRIYARIPNAMIILATPIHRTGEATTVGTGAAAGVKFEHIREAIRAIAKSYKYLLCETSECGINELNHTTYLTDGVHPNNSGYARMANVEKNVFRKIYGE